MQAQSKTPSLECKFFQAMLTFQHNGLFLSSVKEDEHVLAGLRISTIIYYMFFLHLSPFATKFRMLLINHPCFF